MDEFEILRLVRLAQTGDREAFGQLAMQLERTVFATVFRRLRNRSEALEVTQDVFMQAMKKVSQLREPERFVGWLRRIAIRMAINRALRRPREVSGTDFGSEPARTNRESPIDRAMRTETADQVRDGLDRLRDLDRRTLVAFYFEGRSLQEMSDQFCSPVGTIKRRLHMARNRLRDALSDAQLVS